MPARLRLSAPVVEVHVDRLPGREGPVEQRLDARVEEHEPCRTACSVAVQELRELDPRRHDEDGRDMQAHHERLQAFTSASSAGIARTSRRTGGAARRIALYRSTVSAAGIGTRTVATST